MAILFLLYVIILFKTFDFFFPVFELTTFESKLVKEECKHKHIFAMLKINIFKLFIKGCRQK